MKKRKLRTAHIMRSVFYSQSHFALVVTVWLILPILQLLDPPGNYVYTVAQPICLIAFALSVLIFTFRVTIAYKYYFQFNHPFLTVLTSQIITFLVLALISLFTGPID